MTSNDTQPEPPPPLWPFLLLCAVTAVWIDFGTIHRQHHADSLVPVLTSLYHWTPYYWATNRYGMLVPFLAIPFKHPLANLLVQDGLMIFSGLSALFLLPSYVLRDRSWPTAALAGTTIFLVLAPDSYRFAYLVDQCYGLSLALGLGGLLLAEPKPAGRLQLTRSVLALIFLCLAHWVNVGIGLLLALIVVLRCIATGKLFFKTNEGKTAEALLLLAIGFCLGLACMQLAPYRETAEGITPPGQWFTGWRRLASNTWTSLSPNYWPILLAITATVGIALQLCLPSVRKLLSVVLRGAAVCVVAALLYGSFVGTLEWVARGSFTARYTIPSVILFHTGASILTAAPLSSLLELHSRKWFYAAPFVLIAANFRYGPPSYSGVQDDIEVRLGARSAEVQEAKCTHVVGNYWIIWPTIFHANLVRYQRGYPGVIWGVSFRSDPLRKQIEQVPVDQIRIAVPHDDADAPQLLREYHFPPLMVKELRRTVAILVPAVNDKKEPE